MKKYAIKLSLWAVLLVGLTLLFAMSALAEEPLITQIEASPTTLAGPGNVRVSINITNNSDTDGVISVTLYDPNNQVCGSFGSGGTAQLAAGASQSYSGSWNVTQAQLEAGRVTYSAHYTMTDASGRPIIGNKPLAVSIQHNTARPGLKATRSYPSGGVIAGQTVQISYELINVGTLDLTDITIEDPGITSEIVTYPLLKVGEKDTVTYSYIAGTTSQTTQAQISYSFDLNGKIDTKTETDSPRVIDVTIPDLQVTLTADPLLIEPGDQVTFRYTITNRSDLSYEQLRIVDEIMGDLDQNVSLGARETFSGEKTIYVSAATDYQLRVTGLDSAGNPVSFQSNICSVTLAAGDATDDPLTAEYLPVLMTVVAESDRDVIYEEPGEVVFRIAVTNHGETPLNNVAIRTSGKDIKTIAVLEPGQTYELLKRFTVLMAGTYEFTATARDSDDEAQSFTSNAIPIAYHKILPPATPPPTLPPTMPPATVAPTDDLSPFSDNEGQSGGLGSILLYVLLGVLAVILLGVLAMALLGRRKSPQGGHGGQGTVIASLERAPRRDYARAPSARELKRSAKSEPPKRPAPPEPEEAPPQKQPAPMTRAQRPEGAFPGKRPERSAPPVQRPEPTRAKKPLPPPPSENTEVYQRAVLAELPEEAPKVLPDEPPLSAQLSPEDAALLAGSTSQYFLTRKPELNVPPPNKVEREDIDEAEAFARRMRETPVETMPKQQWYDADEDEEEEEEPPVQKAAAGTRRRRK
ncbi:MAG: hypothetical protein LBM74_00105 [Oscillospiraceae bacterium]|jgi:hypothetical protein|nr:hypothetical protein [Oscillospiraceae bacterium]